MTFLYWKFKFRNQLLKQDKLPTSQKCFALNPLNLYQSINDTTTTTTITKAFRKHLKHH